MGRAAFEASAHFLVGAMLYGCASRPATSPRDAADANDTGRTVAVKSEADRNLLRQLPALPVGTTRQIGHRTVVADAPYASASGRTCRAVHVSGRSSGQATSHLACTNGQDWFFVPDVFGPTE